MNKKRKKKSYKISAAAALGCLVCTATVMTNGISVKAVDVNDLPVIKNTIQYDKNEKCFIDAKIKHYKDIQKIHKLAGFDFKLPDYTDNIFSKAISTSVEKITDNHNSVNLFAFNYDKKSKAKRLDMVISEYDPVKTLEEIYKDKRNTSDVKLEKEQYSIKGMDGDVITITVNTPEEKCDDYVISAEQDIFRYFVFNDNGVNYAIQSSHENRCDNTVNTINNLSDDDIYTVLSSLNNIDDVKNIDYNDDGQELSTELGVMAIYDEEDLEKAKNIIGFNPKFPVNINENIKLSQSIVGITAHSDIPNNKIKYNLWTRYEIEDTVNNSDGHSFITFISSQNNDMYDEVKTKGYYTEEQYDAESDEPSYVNVNADKINLGGRDVYKLNEVDENYKLVHYVWEEDGVYYQLILWNTDDNDNTNDSLAQIFIESKENK